MKKLLSTIIGVLLFAGMSVAQNNGHSNEATIEQVGDYQNAEVFQQGSHSAEVVQMGQNGSAGIGNTAEVNQLPGDDAPGGDRTFPPGNPDGVPFQGGVDGSGLASSVAMITQYGEENESFVDQFGSHWAEILQDGFRNSATIWQESGGSGTPFNPPGNPDVCPPPMAPCTGSSDGSNAYVHQDGYDNNADIYQLGGANTAIIEQFGNNNLATIIQSTFGGNNNGPGNSGNNGNPNNNGVGNGINIQSNNGDGIFGHIIQENDGNIATLEQYGNPLPIKIEQTGDMEIHVVKN